MQGRPAYEQDQGLWSEELQRANEALSVARERSLERMRVEREATRTERSSMIARRLQELELNRIQHDRGQVEKQIKEDAEMAAQFEKEEKEAYFQRSRELEQEEDAPGTLVKSKEVGIQQFKSIP